MEKYYDPIKDMDVSEIDQNTIVGFINEFAGKTFAQDRSKHIQPTLCGHTPANTGCIMSCYYAPKEILQYYIPKDEELQSLLSYAKTVNYDLYVACSSNNGKESKL